MGSGEHFPTLIYYRGVVERCRKVTLISVLNKKAVVVAAFNQEKALVEGPGRGLLRDYEPSDGTF